MLLTLVALAWSSASGAPSNSIARVWNERALASIRVDTPHPPAQARNLFSYSVCMYDAWAAYDPVAVGYVYRGKHTAPDVATARSNAISYAVWRMLKERHVYSRTAPTARSPPFVTSACSANPANPAAPPTIPTACP